MQLYENFEDENYNYQLLEYVEGITLKTYLEFKKKIPEDEALVIFK